MNVNTASSVNHYTPVHNAALQGKMRDNDGDYDNGTGQDDVAKSKALQAAAQPHLGSKIDTQA